MKSAKKWGPIAVATLLLISGFQNCSPVAFKESEEMLASEKGIVETKKKRCDLENKNEGDLWMSQAGQERELIACTVGVGNQFNVYNLAKEYTCTNGSAVLTGRSERLPAGKEGLCDLNCGNHLNGELWFMDLGTSKETVACPTSINQTSLLTFANSAQYKCTNAVASATGVVEKKKISETPCPVLTFNDQDNQATLAYEDVIKDSDADYDDFVSNVKVIETYSSVGELTKIMIEYAARKKEAGYKHQLIGVFDGTVRGRGGFVSNQAWYKSEPMFAGNAKIKFEQFQGSALINSVDNVPKNADLVIFDDTTAAVKNQLVSRITITDIDGKSNLLSVRKGLSIKRYRSLLYVPAQGGVAAGYDIDISDINPSSYDNTGKSLAFFVPVNWKTPISQTSILLAYPDFSVHTKFMKDSITNPNLVESDQGKYWYKNVVNKYVN
ncbi:MAG: hypothetical protein EOP09_03420 [Proteobacteria bacterium]|nr:MAG: hypothetical protein EOP09_03420 [Pseudomonadota bacterium]